jgi:ATP-binding cassette subfamily B protein
VLIGFFSWLWRRSRRLVQTLRRHPVPEIRQMDPTECGAACLAMILNYYGRKTRLAEVRKLCGVGRDGLSALAVVKGARSFGLRVRAFAQQNCDFRYVDLPAIIHWNFNHFLIVERWSPGYVDLVDPALGRRRVSAQEFDEGFTGVVLTLEPGVQFSRQDALPGLSLWSYVRQMLRKPAFILQLLGVSLLLQLLGLVQPALTAFIVDRVIPGGMQNIVLLLGLGILVLVLAEAIMTLLRATVLLYLQARLDSRMMLNFFEHLLTLPYRFFQQRMSGDLLTRLSSSTFIRDLFTNQLVSNFLDGGFVLVYLFILFWQSSLYGLLALTFGFAQVLLLVLTSRIVRRLSQKELDALGISQGYMNEVLTGIATVKAAGAEAQAQERWTNYFFDQLNISLRKGYVTSLVDLSLNTLRLFAPLALLWVGVQQVLAGYMSLGTMLALNSLVTAFLIPLGSLVSSGQHLQQVGAHFDRIADVLEEESEQNLPQALTPPRLSGQIELRNVNFRYHPNGKLVLDDINVCITAGQKIALVGYTGSGKSTLGRLLLALYQPTEGEIFYDGMPLSQMNYREVRSQFGVVLQESLLFSGSVRENISFNRPDMDMQQIVWAASVADIHNDIMRMPMQYETFVSEAGSALSGGQRQRVAIARALAHRPTVILFDEATSHLDVITERNVEQNLRALACTRIIIAHRLSTIRDADLILVLAGGKIVERGTHTELLQRGGYYLQLIRQQLENAEAVNNIATAPTEKLRKSRLPHYMLEGEPTDKLPRLRPPR